MDKIKYMSYSFAMIVLCIGILLVVYFTQPDRWRAYALVQIGQVSPGNYIEPMVVTCERFRFPYLAYDASLRTKNPKVAKLIDIDKDAAITYTIINSDVLKINITASDKELAKIATEAVVDYLIERHDKILYDYQEDIRARISDINTDIENRKKIIDFIQENFNKEKTDSIKEYFYLDSNVKLFADEKKRLYDYMSMISSSSAHKTKLLEPITVKEKRFISKLWRAMIIGALLGIFFSIIILHRRKNII